MGSTIRARLCIVGAVQGVGFRPAVSRLAGALGLAGLVRNTAQGVTVEVEGAEEGVQAFILRLDGEKPPLSFIQSMETTWLEPAGYADFSIGQSEVAGPVTALVLPDIAPCGECVAEMFDPGNRRHRYPFINCTHCGPRYSIIEALPYDRPNTVMREFEMCAECRREYEDAGDRRFHAQPIACPVCGPQIELWDAGGRVLAGREAALAGAA